MTLRIHKSVSGLAMMLYGTKTNEGKLQRQIATGGCQAAKAKWHRSEWCGSLPWVYRPFTHMATVRVRQFRLNGSPCWHETEVLMDINGRMVPVGTLCEVCGWGYHIALLIEHDPDQQWVSEIVGEEQRR